MNRPWHAFYPESVSPHIQIPSLSIYNLLERSEHEYAASQAVIDGDKELTYYQLKNLADHFASALYERGFRKGDRIALMLPNCAEYIIAYFGVHRLGGVVVQVNPSYQHTELEYILIDSEAKWFVGHNKQKEKLEKTGLSSKLTAVFVHREPGHDDYDFYDLISSAGSELPPLEIQPEKDLAVLQYTGGTTGRSKGVMLTHMNLISNVYQSFAFSAGIFKVPGEKMLSISPFFHVYGMTSALNIAIYAAAAIICVVRFQVEQTLHIIQKHKPTFFPGVPTMYIALLHHPDSEAAGLDSIKICNSGSAPMPVEVLREFERKAGARIIEGYGLSEASPVTHRNPAQGQRKVGSIGIPIPNTDAKIVDIATGTVELPPGEPGELLVKGPQVMRGYWKKPEETQLALRDGWLYTGDIATMDEDGYFYIVGRKKEMIIAGGYNIYPVEVEEVLYQHSAVEEACVFGIPDPYRGEAVKAIIVPKKSVRITEQEVMDWCRKRMAAYKVPRIIEFREGLPKTAVGKILRRKLVEEEIQRGK
ncbi:long-chain-fatty-acid--CoA ligase [Aneurinibacillus tyrosinisolvens]|uniref:long-chain-fatty-acid--CoA ligase n=1 Tax=Aneurinibacillus tyrosinisolvens TaxID=1443435 RepID=UPI00063F52A1|nr:long-chain fatty acid--CoA ligase [Aneurinibacillus tyrosinisolvens]